MKVIVRANRRDELLQQKQEWDDRQTAQKAQYDEEYGNLKSKEKEICDSVTAEVSSYLSGINLEGLIVRTEPTYFNRDKGVEVTVDCNDRFGGRGENTALRWSWTVKIDSDGTPKKKTSPWSGLEATTEAQIGQLKETVSALEILNSIDWNQLLNVELPQWEEYITVSERIPNRPNFESDIFDEELKALIGTNILVKGMFRPDESNRYSKHTSMNKKYYQYYMVIKDSGSQYTVADFSSNAIEKWEEYKGSRNMTLSEYIDKNAHGYRIRKDTFQQMLFKPLETVDVSEGDFNPAEGIE